MSDTGPVSQDALGARASGPVGASPLTGTSSATAQVAERTSALAAWSLVSSVLGYFCLWGVGGVLGVALGVLSRSEISDSGGRLGGKRLATAGIALGALNLLVVSGALGTLLMLGARSSATAAAPPDVTVPPPPAPAPVVPPPPTPRAVPRTEPRRQSEETGVVVSRVGVIDLVDLDRTGTPLADELAAQTRTARADHKRVVVWTVQEDCKPCNGVAVALSDPRLQRALTGVRLVRVDISDFPLELTRLAIPVGKIPGFCLLAPDGRPVDYVHGGEWDEDVPENIAPVLERFVKGRYASRRFPWAGIEREDETAL